MKSVIRCFLLYACGNLAVRGVNGVITPLILRKILPAEFGFLALLINSIAVATPLVGLGLRQFLAIEYFHCSGTQQSQLVHTLMIIYSISSAIIVSSLCMTWSWWAQSDYQLLQLSAILITLLTFFVELVYQLLRYQQRAVTLTILQLSAALSTAITTLGCLYYTPLRITSIVIGQAIGQIVVCLCGLPLCCSVQGFKTAVRRLDSATCWRYIASGIVFIPNMLFAWILASSDRWFLARYACLTDVGLYAVADTVCQLFQTLVLNAWAGSYLPMMLSAYQQSPETILAIERSNMRWMWIAIGICLSGVILSATYATQLMYWVLPPAYHQALSCIWYLLLGQIALLGSYFASTLIQFQKKQLFLSCGLLIPATINGILNYILIPDYGLTGCALATLSAYCIYFCITLCYNLKIRHTLQARRLYEANLPIYDSTHPHTLVQSGNTRPPEKMANL